MIDRNRLKRRKEERSVLEAEAKALKELAGFLYQELVKNKQNRPLMIANISAKWLETETVLGRTISELAIPAYPEIFVIPRKNFFEE